MMMYELYGLPGCGKTTLTNKILSISTKNISYLSQVYFFKENTLFNKIKIYFLSVFSFKQIHFNFLLLNLLIKIGIRKSRIFDCIRLSKLRFQINNYKKHKTDSTIVLEEGFIQYLSAIIHLKSIDFEILKLDKLYESFYKNISHKTFYLKSSSEKCFDNIRKRKLQNRRFDKMPDSLLLKNLKIHVNLFDFMSVKLGSVILEYEIYSSNNDTLWMDKKFGEIL